MQVVNTLIQQQRFGYVIADELVRNAQAGDMLAHSEIYQTFSQAVMTLAVGICRNTHSAEDIVANTFVKLIGRISSFEFRAPFGMWLRQIAVNESLGYLRKQKKHAYASTDEHDFLNMTAQSSCEKTIAMGLTIGADDFTEHYHAQQALSDALQYLPEHVRLIMWLKEVEGYTHNEIAGLVNKTPSYSKSVVARAYKTLREKLEFSDLNKESAVQ